MTNRDTYLHNYADNDKTVKTIVDTIASNSQVDLIQCTKGSGNLTTSLTFSTRFSKFGGHFGISEFPGNCSALVVNDIYESKEHCTIAVNFGKDLCSALGYAVLFASTNRKTLVDSLISVHGFELILSDVLNPHSGNLNYFLVYKLLVSAEEEENTTEDLLKS